MATKKLEVFAADLPRELWIKILMGYLIPKFPEGYSLGISDDDYSEAVANYLADITVELLNTLHENNHSPAYSPAIRYTLENGNLYSVYDEGLLDAGLLDEGPLR